MKIDISDELLKREIQSIECPQKVDVVEKVMAQVSKQPYLQQRPSKKRWLVAGIAAACLAVVLSVQFVTRYATRYDEAAINEMFSQAYGFGDDFAVEMCAVEELDAMSEMFCENF